MKNYKKLESMASVLREATNLGLSLELKLPVSFAGEYGHISFSKSIVELRVGNTYQITGWDEAHINLDYFDFKLQWFFSTQIPIDDFEMHKKPEINIL
jgi:hypothetical protein